MNVNDMWKVPITDDAQPAMRAEAERAMRRARRDMFAAAALTGMLSNPNVYGAPEHFAGLVIKQADAVLTALAD